MSLPQIENWRDVLQVPRPEGTWWPGSRAQQMRKACANHRYLSEVATDTKELARLDCALRHAELELLPPP